MASGLVAYCSCSRFLEMLKSFGSSLRSGVAWFEVRALGVVTEDCSFWDCFVAEVVRSLKLLQLSRPTNQLAKKP